MQASKASAISSLSAIPSILYHLLTPSLANHPAFKEAFEGCGLPYYNPHSFRHCLSEFGKKICTLEEYKAWSQNLGHDRMSTTLDDYGKIGVDRQFELMGNLSKDKVKNI